jgi:hypothetical protein
LVHQKGENAKQEILAQPQRRLPDPIEGLSRAIAIEPLGD